METRKGFFSKKYSQLFFSIIKSNKNKNMDFVVHCVLYTCMQNTIILESSRQEFSCSLLTECNHTGVDRESNNNTNERTNFSSVLLIGCQELIFNQH